MSRRKPTRDWKNKPPRVPYCTGCGHIFDKKHLMINHRNTNRCGGRFLPYDERGLWLIANHNMNLHKIFGQPEHYSLYYKASVKAVLLRKARRHERSA